MWKPTNNLRLALWTNYIMSMDMGEREGIDTFNLEPSVFIYNIITAYMVDVALNVC